MRLVGPGSVRKGGFDTRNGIWWLAPEVGVVLILVMAIGNGLSQTQKSKESSPDPRSIVKGKSIFELRCATCHGLDGLGGEHAPDIVRRPAVRTLSDEALFNLLHDGIPQQGMPGFSDLGEGDIGAVMGYLRFLQGKSAADSEGGDPERGRALFDGKAGCSACHQMESHGQFIAWDLAGFARDHEAGEIREGILNPSAVQQETAVAVARDGRSFSGMIRNEDNLSLQLQDADGRFYLLMKSTLASVQRKTTPPMPADYTQRLTSTELDDLVSYILSAAAKPDQSAAPSLKGTEPHAQD
jgi:cytochrome c oxidase cbb3-type subunit III